MHRCAVVIKKQDINAQHFDTKFNNGSVALSHFVSERMAPVATPRLLSIADELSKFIYLKVQGILSKEEFDEQKANLFRE